ncbi:DUF2382 domain-containing protein [Aureimonas leprariae]|uniref:DUF2382 domain-containing protein n=1 Tax=Plantimonas leprariae TaxID=2615207 RepID=A0A7V7PT11_9HYPH|nr:DUF2382 domain-containing protein [Aureimonas leprariae]KAB0682751.1 DUF2382 domain-containing protein [Aureimonas leprariae]
MRPDRIADERAAAVPAHPEGEDATLVVAEEALRVNKRDVVTGRVRVRTRTTSREAIAAADLAGETVEVVRKAVDREIDAVPEVRTEGDVTIVPVVEEVLVVETRLVLKEEIHIRRTRSVERFETPVVLRRQDASVDRLADDETGNEET